MILIPVNNPFKKSRHVSPMTRRYQILLDLPCTCWIILGNFDNSQKLAIKTAKILVTPISDLKISLCLVDSTHPRSPRPGTQHPAAPRPSDTRPPAGPSGAPRRRCWRSHRPVAPRPRAPWSGPRSTPNAAPGETSSSCLWVGWGETSSSIKSIFYYLVAWWFIPLSKWVITPVISGLTLLIPFITGVITHVLSGISHHLLPIDL